MRSPRAISLVVRNGLAPAMRPGLLGSFTEACEVFDATTYTNRIGLPARFHTPADVDALMSPLGWELERWHGVRVFTDHRDGEVPAAPDELAAMLAAELEAGRRDPYRRVAALLHLVYRR